MAEAKTTKTAESPAVVKDDKKTDDVRELPKQRVKTLDSTETDLGWTAQHSSRPEPAQENNPVVYNPDELPDPDAMKDQGVVDPEPLIEQYYPEDRRDEDQPSGRDRARL